MDEIVGEREEFRVYANISDNVQSGPSTLSIKSNYDYNAGENSRGFRWVIALARVEFGAMLASFSDVKSPFTAVPPHEFDLMEYKALLLDGARTHYWALVKDEDLKKVFSTNPENPIVLAYSRRMLIAKNMLAAAMRAGQRDYSDIQVRELSSWKDSMDEIQTILVAKIEQYLAQNQTSVTTNTRTRNTPYAQACGAMLRAEARELESGTARVRKYP